MEHYCVVLEGDIRCYVKASSIEVAIAKLKLSFNGGELPIVSWYTI